MVNTTVGSDFFLFIEPCSEVPHRSIYVDGCYDGVVAPVVRTVLGSAVHHSVCPMRYSHHWEFRDRHFLDAQ